MEASLHCFSKLVFSGPRIGSGGPSSFPDEECFIKSFICGGFGSAEELQDIVMCIPRGGPRTLSQGYAIFCLFVSFFLFKSFQGCTQWHMEVPKLGVKSEL